MSFFSAFSARRLLFTSNSRPAGLQNYKITKKVNVSPHLLYLVIADVSRYHEFVPFVTTSFVNKVDNVTKLPTEAGIRVGWKQYDENFTCKLICSENSIIAESLTILLFESLHSEWRLREIRSRFTKELSTLVELELSYKFRNPLYNALSSLFHEQVSSIMIRAFENRAVDIKLQNKLKDHLNGGTKTIF